MNSTWLFRIAAVLLVVFAVGHTAGFLSFRPPTNEGIAVYDAMKRVHFQIGRASFSYGGFYVGFGLFVTAYLLFAAVLAWQLGGLARTHADAIGGLSWCLFAVQLASLALSWIFFSMAPVIFSAVIAACIGLGSWMLGTGARITTDGIPSHSS
jgi:hypothetical protein